MSKIALAFSLLSLLNPFNYFGDNLSPQVKMGARINAESGKRLSKKYGMHPCGTSLQIHEEVEGLGLTFQYYKPIPNIDEARKLLMTISKEHCDYLINSEELKPYLKESFSLEDVSISLFIQNQDGSDVYHPLIGRASFYGNCAYFITDDENNRYNKIAEIKEPRKYLLDIVEGRIPPPVYKEFSEGYEKNDNNGNQSRGPSQVFHHGSDEWIKTMPTP